MPNYSGLLCYKKMKRSVDLNAIPVILMSAFGTPQDFKGERFRKFIAAPDIPEPEGFHEKPIHRLLFLELVKAILGDG